MTGSHSFKTCNTLIADTVKKKREKLLIVSEKHTKRFNSKSTVKMFSWNINNVWLPTAMSTNNVKLQYFKLVVSF